MRQDDHQISQAAPHLRQRLDGDQGVESRTRHRQSGDIRKTRAATSSLPAAATSSAKVCVSRIGRANMVPAGSLGSRLACITHHRRINEQGYVALVDARDRKRGFEARLHAGSRSALTRMERMIVSPSAMQVSLGLHMRLSNDLNQFFGVSVHRIQSSAEGGFRTGFSNRLDLNLALALSGRPALHCSIPDGASRNEQDLPRCRGPRLMAFFCNGLLIAAAVSAFAACPSAFIDAVQASGVKDLTFAATMPGSMARASASCCARGK